MTFISWCYEDLENGIHVTRFGSSFVPVEIRTRQDLKDAINHIAVSSVVHNFTVLFWKELVE